VGVSFRQLRETCQLPVRHHNDVAGLLFGDRCSLPLTKLFVDLRLSPSIATVAFLVCGLLGSALQLVGPAWAVAGAALLVLYYILDCVDGEVARWQGVEDMRWGYFDYVFHMVVKPTCFLAVAVGTWLELGNAWLLLAGASAAGRGAVAQALPRGPRHPVPARRARGRAGRQPRVPALPGLAARGRRRARAGGGGRGPGRGRPRGRRRARARSRPSCAWAST
jgi:hypothetical protein